MQYHFLNDAELGLLKKLYIKKYVQRILPIQILLSLGFFSIFFVFLFEEPACEYIVGSAVLTCGALITAVATSFGYDFMDKINLSEQDIRFISFYISADALTELNGHLSPYRLSDLSYVVKVGCRERAEHHRKVEKARRMETLSDIMNQKGSQ